MKYTFCPYCARPLTLKAVGDEGEQKYCANCGKFYFDNPACCILTVILNEKKEVLLLKQNHISKEKYVLCSGYVKNGDSLEETVIREVLEETGQKVLSLEYVKSYYFEPKSLIMPGFIAYVKASSFGSSKEVNRLIWTSLDEAKKMVERNNNFSGTHLDNCIELLNKYN